VTWQESLLSPLALVYGAAAHLRARAYRKGILHQLRLPGAVISVGNLTVGGTGKTPLVIWIAERLVAEGKKAGILTRGYRGKSVESEHGGKGISTSDEVQLLQARLGEGVAFGVGPDRFAQGCELAKRGVDWFVLDDGFQHLRLARDVDIVVVDATNPFGGGHILPAGRLRESRTALARADIVVITRSLRAPAVEAAIRRDTDAPIFYARATKEPVVAPFAPQLTETDAMGRKLFAFCAIGNPAAFVADLRDWGFQIVGHKFFRDHYRYTAADVREIERAARDAGADGVICTEKDRYNLPGAWGAMDLWVAKISLSVEREEALWRAMMSHAEARGGGRG
jgi:tetraacyldisaccharide 4'-kinase